MIKVIEFENDTEEEDSEKIHSNYHTTLMDTLEFENDLLRQEASGNSILNKF